MTEDDIISYVTIAEDEQTSSIHIEIEGADQTAFEILAVGTIGILDDYRGSVVIEDVDVAETGPVFTDFIAEVDDLDELAGGEP